VRRTLIVPPDPTSVGVAREFVRAAVVAGGFEEADTFSALLLTSELVTNAVLHAGTDLEVGLDVGDDAIRVEVTDRGAGYPLVERAGLDAEQGRGLMIVSRLASRWGVAVKPDRKAVWFELGGEQAARAS
jgi:anti-sigma regulatory factor (Ser/Thr protein kinase)